MSKVGMIKIKPIEELKAIETPTVKKVRIRRAATTTKKVKLADETAITESNRNVNHQTASAIKSESRSNKKELLSGQKRIDTFFKSAAKTYKIEKEVNTTIKEEAVSRQTSTKKRNSNTKAVSRKAKVCKRLYPDSTDTETTTTMSIFSDKKPVITKKRRTPRKQPHKNSKNTQPILKEPEYTVDLCSDSEPEIKVELKSQPEEMKQSDLPKPTVKDQPMVLIPIESDRTPLLKPLTLTTNDNEVTCKDSVSETASTKGSTASKGRTRKPKPCPPYKVIEGTTFAVDAFQFGDIPNVTHYFLTHYHADHYVGLNGKFCHPLYASPITARLVRTFIPLDQQYLHELELNKPLMLEDVEVTAIDANHCPGAIMIVFKFRTGKCILHTGDFRACADMESEPFFWNNDISLIYLDTTYLCNKYDFCHQSESIDKAKLLVDQFRQKHEGQRILYVCGSYVIGKEKMWKALALEYGLNVWTDPSRFKSLSALQDPEIDLLLCEDRQNANLHVITMMKLHYQSLVEYFQPFQSEYDVLLAIRPSGWENKSRPQYRGRINLIGIEYSEHSSYTELERFVKYLKPERVISTVPVSRDLFVTAKVPQLWYKYKGYGRMTKCFQQSITTFIKSAPNRQSLGNVANMLVSPIITQAKAENSKNLNTEYEHLAELKTSPAAKQLNFPSGASNKSKQDEIVTINDSTSTVYESKTAANESFHTCFEDNGKESEDSVETLEWKHSSPVVLDFNEFKGSQNSVETVEWQPHLDEESKENIKTEEQEQKPKAMTERTSKLLPKTKDNFQVVINSDASDDWLT